VEQLQAVFTYRTAYVYPDRVFMPLVNNLLDGSGKLKDPELLLRLRAQAEGFVKFVELTKQVKLRG
jgi:hypothetical protein